MTWDIDIPRRSDSTHMCDSLIKTTLMGPLHLVCWLIAHDTGLAQVNSLTVPNLNKKNAKTIHHSIKSTFIQPAKTQVCRPNRPKQIPSDQIRRKHPRSSAILTDGHSSPQARKNQNILWFKENATNFNQMSHGGFIFCPLLPLFSESISFPDFISGS